MLPSNASDWEAASPNAGKPRRSGSGRSRAIAGIVILLVLIVGLVGIFVGRLAFGGPVAAPRPTAVAAARPTAGAAAGAGPSAATPGAAAPAQPGTPADAATQQSIQQVIQQVDQAQQQALASNDPTVMQTSSTSEFYQEQVQTNDDLKANGVTDIKLVNVEWGPITVDNSGTTATATNWETWSTTLDDGTTEQSRDRNVYTLVQQNGNWKVSADEHPDADQPGGPAGGAPGGPGGGPPSGP